MQNRNILVTYIDKNKNFTHGWFEDEEEAKDFIEEDDIEPIDFLDVSNCRELYLNESEE